jgi:hypothetical protein
VTLKPHESTQVRGVQGPAYKVGPRCANPNCQKIAEHAHHIWRRSALGGAFDWVAILEDGGEWIVANKTGLCADCHNDVTGRLGGHRARIIYDRHHFFWALVTPKGEHEVGPIVPQPPTPETLSRLGHSPESEACPFCGQPPRRRASTHTLPGARRRKTWRVLVPDDAENGADILDTLVEDIGLTIGVDPVASGRYYILLPVLYHACQSKTAFVESLQGVGG